MAANPVYSKLSQLGGTLDAAKVDPTSYVLTPNLDGSFTKTYASGLIETISSNPDSTFTIQQSGTGTKLTTVRPLSNGYQQEVTG